MENLRKEDRYSLFQLAMMRLADQAVTLRIKVRNLSPGGMMVECPVHAERGERVTIDLRNVGWIGGRVTWAVENRFGVAFDREIDWKTVRQPVTVNDPAPEIYVPRPVRAHEPEPASLRRV